MHTEIKNKWLAALRSGEFKQGHGRLEDVGTFCCLGVLFKLAEAEGVVTRHEVKHFQVDGVGAVYGYERALGVLPREVVAWAGIATSDSAGGQSPVIEYLGEITELWQLNDLSKLSFQMIADAIEADTTL